MILLEEPDPKPCKGKIFKGKVNVYIGKRGEYVHQEKMVLMKRLSCDGCDRCDFLTDDLNEFTYNGHLPIIKSIEDGALYYLKVANVTRDWETGYADDWDLEFIHIP